MAVLFWHTGGAKIASGSLPHSMAKASRKQRIRDKREARKQDRTAGSDDDDAQQRTGAEFKVSACLLYIVPEIQDECLHL